MWVMMFPLYAVDGKTVIGRFNVSPSTVIIVNVFLNQPLLTDIIINVLTFIIILEEL